MKRQIFYRLSELLSFYVKAVVAGPASAAPLFQPSTLSAVSLFSPFRSFYFALTSDSSLNFSYTVSEHSLWTYPKEKFKFTSIQLNDSSKNRGGERLGRPILSPPPPHPSKMLLPFYLYVYTTLSLYLSSND